MNMKVPQVSIDDFLEALVKKLEPKSIPLTGFMELTHRCNLRCVHCYCNQKANSDLINQELSTNEICHLLDTITDEGCLSLLFSGGEVLLRPDFLEIYSYAKRKGLLITLFTNGTLITRQIADYLGQYPPKKVEITLYGMRKETHEKITGVPGSFERCLQGIKLICQQGICLNLKTIAMRLNYTELGQMKEFAKSLGAHFRFDPFIHSRLDGCRSPTQLRLSPETIASLDLADEERAEGLRQLFQRPMEPCKSERLYPCQTGKFNFYIDPYGHMFPCVIARRPSFDLRKGSFREGFHNFFAQILAQKSKPIRCFGCKLRSICYQCAAWSQLEHGDNVTPVDWLCQIAHLQAKTFGKEVNENGKEKEKTLSKAHDKGDKISAPRVSLECV